MKKIFRALLLLLSACAFAQTPIAHVVIIVKENRSFDHMFGTFPGANGATTGLVSSGATGATIPLAKATDSVIPDIDHSWRASHAAIDNGKMDHFDLENNCGAATNYHCYSQYSQSQISSYWSYAQNYVLHDNFFSSQSGPSLPNHLYLIASTSANMINLLNGVLPGGHPNNWGCDADAGSYVDSLNPATGKTYRQFPCLDSATLGDILESAGLSWRYYAPSIGQAGYQWSAYDAINHIRNNSSEWTTHVVPVSQFITDAASGNLPAVSWVTPPASLSEHPSSPMSKGMNWTVQQINAVMSGPDWPSTVIFVTWDDWGGFYDHVPPPLLDVFGSGMRVPLLIISPFVQPGTICHDSATFDSLLAFVEHNWNLGPLTQRDANANDLFSCFNSTLAATPTATTAGPLLLGMVPEPKLTKARQKAIDQEITRDRVNDPDD